MFVLAHLSDPHLSPFLRPGFFDLVGKRALGYLNWQLRRRAEHRIEVLDAILRDLAEQGADHVAVTGDLVNIALPGEFAPAREFLGRIGPPERVTFIPGNHDTYVRATLEHSHQHFGEYMRGDHPPGTPAPIGAERFPFVRRRGKIAIIGTSTAIPTGPFMATGRLGEAQLRWLRQYLAGLKTERVFRMVLLHHPPFPFPGDRRKRLLDAEPFRQVLQEHGAELVLHGHIHLRSYVSLPGPDHAVPVVGVPSASAFGRGHDRAGYNLYRIESRGDLWQCEMVARGFGSAGGPIVELERRALLPVAALQPAQ